MGFNQNDWLDQLVMAIDILHYFISPQMVANLSV